MTVKLMTRVSPQFDPANFEGVVVAGEELSDTHGFTELGYDQVDYDVAPTVFEIEATATRYANEDDVYAAAEKAGLKLWMSKEEFLAENPRHTSEQFHQCKWPAMDGTEANVLLFNPDVVRHLEEAGFEAFRDVVAVSNDQPLLTCFWKPGTFKVNGPVEVIAPDEDEPYMVVLASETPRIAP